MGADRRERTQPFFFKKSGSQTATARNKKLLSVSDGTEFGSLNSVPAAMGESFLLLFFKKEGLFFAYFPFCQTRQLRKQKQRLLSIRGSAGPYHCHSVVTSRKGMRGAGGASALRMIGCAGLARTQWPPRGGGRWP